MAKRKALIKAATGTLIKFVFYPFLQIFSFYLKHKMISSYHIMEAACKNTNIH